MAEILDGTGVITKTSSNSCTLCITVDGDSKSVTFKKHMFYTFGVQCEGDMTNILEDGMEVDLSYRIFSSRSKPCIVAVWLGEKPDDLTEDNSSLKAMYESHGYVVSYVDNNNFIVQDEDSNAVYINKNIVFRDGLPLEDKENLAIDVEVIFDAIPFKNDHPSGASYEATCAWIGPKPRLIDRFDLRSCKLDTGFSGRQIVEGTVAVIPNNVVAIVDVVSESMPIKVFLFGSSFKKRCARIGEVVDVGDSVCMRLGYKSVFPGRRLWYAVKASKSRDEIRLDNASLCEEVSPESFIEFTKSTSGINIAYDQFSNIPSLSSVIGTKSSWGYNVADDQLFKFSKNTEVLCNIPPLSGVISRLSYDQGACITYGDLKIFVHRDNFYIAGKRCSDAEFIQYVASGTNIAFFEAIIVSLPDQGNSGFTHEATCAWVGRNQKPTVHVLASSLCKPNPSLLEKGWNFYGVVSKYLSPFVAFAFIPDESTFVLIDVSNFVSLPRYPPVDGSKNVFITNHVKLNDTVQFKVQANPRFPELFLTYDIRHGALSEDTCEKISPGGISPAPLTKRLSKQKSAKETVATNVVAGIPSKSQPDLPPIAAKSTFSKDSPSKNRGFLLNCSGTLTVVAPPIDNEVKVVHLFGTSNVNLSRVGFLQNDTPLNSNEMLKLNNVKVRFDAEFAISPEKNVNFQVVRLWRKKKARPDSECLFACSLARWERLFSTLSGCLETRKLFYSAACIHSIPLHDTAIATVEQNGLSVLVTLDSLVTLEEISLDTSCIENYLRIGHKIFAKIEKRNYNNNVSYFRTVKCFPGTNFPQVNSDAEFEACAPRRNSWANIWGLGEWYRKGQLICINGKYYVEMKKLVELDLEVNTELFEKGQVFVGGRLADPEMLKEYVGEEITVHFARDDSECSNSNAREALFVVWAWIGEEPSPRHILTNLTVPKGLVCSRYRYEVVIAGFPFPTHALCYIGDVPVLVQLVQNETGCNLLKDIKSELMDLKVGDRLVVQVYEESLGDGVILRVRKNVIKASKYPLKDVFRNVAGTIVALPEPAGKIKVADGNLEIAFELCHVRGWDKSVCESMKEWFDCVRVEIAVGKRVCCSAAQTWAESGSCRAFEVRLIK